MDKVKISKERANFLDNFANDKLDWIFSQLADWNRVEKTTKEMSDLHIWYLVDPVTVSKALINGYEVEETPEDKVRELYIEQNRSLSEDQLRSDVAIKKVLNLLNIKIEGVNHE